MSLIKNSAKTINKNNISPFILVCEHASNFIPSSYNSLGLNAEQIESHIAWDINAKNLSLAISTALNATLIYGQYSRLLYDCNRHPTDNDAIITLSDNVKIIGNQNIVALDRDQRIDKIYQTFHQEVDLQVQQHLQNNANTVLINIHSFTPHYKGQDRKVEIGVIYKDNNIFATNFYASLQQQSKFNICKNEPYSAKDNVLHTIYLHGIKNNINNVMLEVRNDLIATEKQLIHMSNLIAKVLVNINNKESE